MFTLINDCVRNKNEQMITYNNSVSSFNIFGSLLTLSLLDYLGYLYNIFILNLISSQRFTKVPSNHG